MDCMHLVIYSVVMSMKSMALVSIPKHKSIYIYIYKYSENR